MLYASMSRKPADARACDADGLRLDGRRAEGWRSYVRKVRTAEDNPRVHVHFTPTHASW